LQTSPFALSQAMPCFRPDHSNLPHRSTWRTFCAMYSCWRG